MKAKHILWFGAIWLICITSAYAQYGHLDKQVKYTPDFNFTDGLYVAFEQVKQNRPIPKASLVSATPYRSNNFFTDLTQSANIFYFDKYGTKQSVPTNEIWGYANNGVLYIRMDKNFFRVTIVGSICHFVAMHEVTNNVPASVYYDPYLGYTQQYGSVKQTTRSIKQYVLDFENGKVLEYNYKNIEILLQKDLNLYEEYAELRKKQKKRQMFLYLRKFNEKHPLYLPVYE